MAGEELILSMGFTRTGTCNCGGYYTEKYTKANYEISWRRKRYLVKLKKSGETIFGWIPIHELDKAITETKSEAVLN